MKRILMALMVATAFCSLVLAQQNSTIVKDSIGKAKVTVTQTTKSSPTTAVTVSSADNDSTIVAEYTDTPDDSTYISDVSSSSYSYGNAFDFLNDANKSTVGAGIAMAIIVLLIVFSFPLFIIFIAFYFRYRNRKARYKLVEQALASGHPLPEGMFKESLNLDTKSKGIKNICLGIGLSIFLWALTNSFAMSCIGLLIMFTGIGQYLIAKNQKPTDEQK